MSSPSGTLTTPTTEATGPRPAATTHAYDAGLLLLRVALGLTIATHGSQKLFGWFGGGGIDGTGMFFTSLGYPSGKVMAVVAGLCETLGGLGLALGLLTPLAGAAVLGAMVNAVSADWSGGFFSPKGIEYPLLIGLAAAGLALTGPGRIAADRFLPGLRTHRLAYGAAAVVIAVALAAVTLLLKK